MAFNFYSLLAAVQMFTRLPLWRIVKIDKIYFTKVLQYWPFVGYLTSGITILTLWCFSGIIPVLPACILAIIARLFFTGALHEDGLSDFFDGFGGGTTKERILAIMKDSHTGAYGVIGLILYFSLYTSFLYSIPVTDLLPCILTVDVFSKFSTAILINSLTYVRKEEDSKVKLLYQKISPGAFVLTGILVLSPLIFIQKIRFLPLIIPMIATAFFLRHYLKSRIGGYTGDCCGASMLIIEQAGYLSATILYFWEGVWNLL